MVMFETARDFVYKEGSDPNSRWLSSGDADQPGKHPDVVEVPEGWAICADDVKWQDGDAALALHNTPTIHSWATNTNIRPAASRPIAGALHLRRAKNVQHATFLFGRDGELALVAESVSNYPVTGVIHQGTPLSSIDAWDGLPEYDFGQVRFDDAASIKHRWVATPHGVMKIPMNWMVLDAAVHQQLQHGDVIGYSTALYPPTSDRHVNLPVFRRLIGPDSAPNPGIGPVIRRCSLQNPYHRLGYFKGTQETNLSAPVVDLSEHEANIKAQLKFFFGCGPTSDAVKNIPPPRVIDSWPDSECDW